MSQNNRFEIIEGRLAELERSVGEIQFTMMRAMHNRSFSKKGMAGKRIKSRRRPTKRRRISTKRRRSTKRRKSTKRRRQLK